VSEEVPIVAAPLDPCTTYIKSGFAEIEKSVADTSSVTVVLWEALVPVPVTVIVYVPGAVAWPRLTIMVDEPPAATTDGLNHTAVVAGWPLAERVMD
jgi:hypothetical protein